MNNKKFRPLRSKITFTIIIVVILSLLGIGAVFLINTNRVSKTLINSNKQMSQTSRSMSFE